MTTFGKHIRRLRKEQGKSLRHVGREIGKTHAYVAQIESGKFPPPSDEVVMALAAELGEDPDVLMAIAGRVSPELAEIVCARPRRFSKLLRQLRKATEEEMDQVIQAARNVRDGNW